MWDDFKYLIRSDRKMQVLLGLFTIMLIAVVTIAITKTVGSNSNANGDTVASMVEEGGKGDWESNQINGGIDNTLFEESATSLGETEVTTQYGGVIKGYEDLATYGALTINIGNKEGKEELFTIRTDSVIFDTQTKGVISASKLNKTGTSITLYATGDIQGEEKKVGVAVINPLSEVMYGKVSKIEYHSGDEIYRITPSTGDRVFYYRDGKYVGNARTGGKIDMADLEEGDNVFIYPADKAELVGVEEEKEGLPMIAIQEMYVIKGK